MKIKVKLSLFSAGAIILSVLIVGGFVLKNMNSVLMEKAEQLCFRISEDFANSLTANIEDKITLREIAYRLGKTEGIAYISFINKRGIIYTHSSAKKEGKRISKSRLKLLKKIKKFSLLGEEKYEGEKVYTFVKPVVIGKKHIGWIELAYSSEAIAKDIRKAEKIILITTIVALVVGIILATLVSGFITRPIVLLTDAVDKVAMGDLSVEINLKTKDEIEILSEAFNEMVVSLREKLAMQKFVSKSAVEMIRDKAKSGEKVALEGERKKIAFLFSDIRGFTSMSEKLEPEEVVSTLNYYLQLQTDIIKRHGGDIDKFVGDEIVAIFQGQNACQNALNSAIEIQREMKKHNERRKKLGYRTVSVGIGIHYGEAVMGSMGSTDRMDYTVIGDNVNLTARLCSSAPPDTIYSTEELKNCTQNDELFEELEPITVKGKSKPIKIFRVKWEEEK